MGFKKREIANTNADSSNAVTPSVRLHSMSLVTIASLLNAELHGASDAGPLLTGVQDDSRKVRKGELFVAVKGMSVDGHDYVKAAAKKGAAALVVERLLDVSIPQLLVDDASRALGTLAAHAAGRPADSLATIGITGTNGKTTTSYLIEAMLVAAGKVPGVLGTVSYRWNGKETPAPYTTPTPLVLQDAFTTMKAEGCDTALLEVSSAALHMDRLVGTQFDVAAFSNLSQDHLDIHKTMEEYRDAKARLFHDQLAPGGTCVINIDDEAGSFMARAAGKAKVLRVSRKPDADAEIRVMSFSSTIDGIEATIATPTGTLEIRSKALIGHYNVDNVALAVGIGEALEIPHNIIAKGISEMHGVPGRVERVDNDHGLNVFVDYAHTPDALENVLAALRPITKARLLCVFGCGGDRDPDKRPQMGAAVAQAADLAFVTSDNPRTEDPQAILDMITPAVPDAFFVDVDRRIAIQAAIAEATPNDVVLIAGKGHEDYQIVGTEKEHFDDREEARAACEVRKSFSKDGILLETQGTCTREGPSSEFSRIVIDGRSAAPGDLYVAIKGERFDGHDFCQQALDAGATGLLVEKGRGQFECATVIEVEDPREALGNIARRYRQQWGGKVIGITGSAGKTTTKDLLAAALRSTGRVHAAKGSNNNETGVPLTLLGMRDYHDYAVIEMGMRALGEIDYLADIALPDVAVVTNAGTAHVGRLGSPAAIARAKGEIYGCHTGGGIGIYPESDPRLADLARACETKLSFADATESPQPEANLSLVSYEPKGVGGCEIVVEYEGKHYTIALPLVGKHNAINACCALLAGIAAGAEPEDVTKSIASVRAPDMRGEIREIAGRNVLVDCYNANPASMEAALQTLSELRGEGGAAFAVLGDMLELGEQSSAAHKRIGKHSASLKIPVVALGEFRKSIVEGASGTGGEAWSAADPLAAARAALACTEPGDWILLKASRGMKLERVADSMQTEAQTDR